MLRFLRGLCGGMFFGIMGIFSGLILGMMTRIPFDEAIPFILLSSLIVSILAGLYFAIDRKPSRELANDSSPSPSSANLNKDK